MDFRVINGGLNDSSVAGRCKPSFYLCEICQLVRLGGCVDDSHNDYVKLKKLVGARFTCGLWTSATPTVGVVMLMRIVYKGAHVHFTQ